MLLALSGHADTLTGTVVSSVDKPTYWLIDSANKWPTTGVPDGGEVYVLPTHPHPVAATPA